MDNCIFCHIVQGTQPAYMLYEDDQFLAFLDLYPYGDGHTLVIPKTHYHWIWDVPNIGDYMNVAKTVALHLQKQFATHTVYSLVFGEQVPHAHIHLLPPLPETKARFRQGFEGLRQPELPSEKAQELQHRLNLNADMR